MVDSKAQLSHVAGNPELHSPPPAKEPPVQSPIRLFLSGRGSSAIVDRSFGALMLLCALSIFAIVFLILFELITRSRLSIDKFGFSFFFRSAWDPVNGDFGALPFIYGTLASSLSDWDCGAAGHWRRRLSH